MVATRQRKSGGKRPLTEILPDMLAGALARQEDFILTHEKDPDTGSGYIHVITGRFVSECMLRKLQGLVEAQFDDGTVMVTRPLADGRKMRTSLPTRRP